MESGVSQGVVQCLRDEPALMRHLWNVDYLTLVPVEHVDPSDRTSRRLIHHLVVAPHSIKVGHSDKGHASRAQYPGEPPQNILRLVPGHMLKAVQANNRIERGDEVVGEIANVGHDVNSCPWPDIQADLFSRGAPLRERIITTPSMQNAPDLGNFNHGNLCSCTNICLRNNCQ